MLLAAAMGRLFPGWQRLGTALAGWLRNPARIH
jgi:hypothetical protein